MSAFADRRTEDLRKLNDLAARSTGKLRILRANGNPPNDIGLIFNLKTAGNSGYPKEVQTGIEVEIKLPARYPFQEPSVNILTPIYHPNVYASGRICFGVKWLPSEGLELLALRIAKIVVFDPAILNERSPANGAAKEWYATARIRYPGAFPTDTFNVRTRSEKNKHISWTNKFEAVRPERVVVLCPQCSTHISLPSGRTGTVKCPSCQTRFEAST